MGSWTGSCYHEIKFFPKVSSVKNEDPVSHFSDLTHQRWRGTPLDPLPFRKVGSPLMAVRACVSLSCGRESKCPRYWCSFWVLGTDPSSNKCVVSVSCRQSCIWFSWSPFILSSVEWNFLASIRRRPVPSLPFQKHESEYWEELLCTRCVVSP